MKSPALPLQRGGDHIRRFTMYAAEQTKREAYQDQAAEEWDFALSELAQLVRRWGKAAIAKELSNLPETDVDMWKDWVPSCHECVNWRCARTFKLSDGSLYAADGFCKTRAGASLEQMPQDYARTCRLFELDCPF
ncbi:MAG: hypothetical protein AAF171_03295 [Cyanobacteria bacterium P01_A01_bin.116]